MDRRTLVLLAVAVTSLLGACAGEEDESAVALPPRIAIEAPAAQASPPPSPTPAPSPEPTPFPRFVPTHGTPGRSWAKAELSNLTIPEAGVDSGQISLEGGVGKAFSTRSYASFSIDIRSITFGDLDGDGTIDAAVLLMTNQGGSGTGYEIAAVVDDSGAPRFVARERLGADIPTLRPVIRDGTILISALLHDEDDHKHEASFPWLFEFRLQGDKLVPRQPRPAFYGGYAQPARPPTAAPP